MDQRKTFLKKASMNPSVRKADRTVAAYLVNHFLTTKADTPRSVLSASQLPFFSDEEEEFAENASNANAQKRKARPKQKRPSRGGSFEKVDGSRVTSADMRCEQRVMRWKQQN